MFYVSSRPSAARIQQICKVLGINQKQIRYRRGPITLAMVTTLFQEDAQGSAWNQEASSWGRPDAPLQELDSSWKALLVCFEKKSKWQKPEEMRREALKPGDEFLRQAMSWLLSELASKSRWKALLVCFEKKSTWQKPEEMRREALKLGDEFLRQAMSWLLSELASKSRWKALLVCFEKKSTWQKPEEMRREALKLGDEFLRQAMSWLLSELASKSRWKALLVCFEKKSKW